MPYFPVIAPRLGFVVRYRRTSFTNRLNVFAISWRRHGQQLGRMPAPRPSRIQAAGALHRVVPHSRAVEWRRREVGAGGRTGTLPAISVDVYDSMANIEFNKDEKAILVRKLQGYFSEELQQKIGQFDAEFLLDFIGKEIGAYYYNHGLYDAQAALSARMEDLQDAIYQLEQRTEFRR